MTTLKLRDEFLDKHMQGTSIELCNRQNTGWAQKSDPNELLDITYPTMDVQRALKAISPAAGGKPFVLIGQRGSGKSHIMALVHQGFTAPDAVNAWASEWSSKPGCDSLNGLQLQKKLLPISETLSNQEYACLWDVIFERHPKGDYYRGQFESNKNALVPAKSLMQDMFQEQPTALIFDELQTWYDGLRDEPGPEGRKLHEWAFNFIQILSELAKDRPDLLALVVSVRDNTTDAYRQIHRVGPVLVDFKGETAREDRKRLVLHRLFENRKNISEKEIEQIAGVYADERNRLLYADNVAEHATLKEEVVNSWPFSPELLNQLEDHILMAAAAQDNRDLIRILAEVFRSRGSSVPVITAADFTIDDDDCGVVSLLDSFASSADQERLREKAMRNLEEINKANVSTPHASDVISALWIRSLSAGQEAGGTRNEVQLDVTRDQKLDDNEFTVELATIVGNSFNIHEVGTTETRYCFKLPENAETRLKVHAKNDQRFAPQTATPAGLLPIGRDQEFIQTVLEYVLKSPDSPAEQASVPVVLDANWEQVPWANVKQQDQPKYWADRGKPVLVVIPKPVTEFSEVLGPWLAKHVEVSRNMTRFLVPKSGSDNIFDDEELLMTARCALAAKEWKDKDSQYDKLHKKYENALMKELKTRFDRYAILDCWDFQTPANCTFHEEKHSASGGDIPNAIEQHIFNNFFAPEDFEKVVVDAAKRQDTVKEVLLYARSAPTPGESAIPYLGEVAIYEEILKVVSQDKAAVEVGGTWYRREADEDASQAIARLKNRAWRSGQQMYAVKLGDPSQVTGGGVAAPASPVVQPPATPATPPPAEPPTPQPGQAHEPPVMAPVIRRSMGAKTGLNLLGDLEEWALADAQPLNQATLTFKGLSIKQVRDIVTKLPPKAQAELQLEMPPESTGDQQ